MKTRPVLISLTALLFAGVGFAQTPTPAPAPAAPKAPPKKLAAVKKDEADALKLPVQDNLDAELKLKSLDGREVNARLISAQGEMIRIQRLDDDRRFDIPLSTLDSFSAERVRNWMDRSPTAIQYLLDISTTKRSVDSGKFYTAGRTLEYCDWTYDIKITNRTRNDLNDASVEYRVVYDDDVDIVRTAVAPGKGSNQQEGEAVTLPVLSYNGRAEFATPPVRLHSFKYEMVRQRKEFERDRIVGIWVRVVRKGEIIGEYKSYPAVMENLVWDGATDVQIVDPFKKATEKSEISVLRR